ncbi:uncharacterized protein LOC113280078 [Papaver somniferum]|uniref:uncharacterized protein LOC113280078 n=1 Tax=Papaver somniferum TaxID=3469 RepID=UPI000E703BFB|nr:uncharacterized protein LOC113280078 [Papaver somniferum]
MTRNKNKAKDLVQAAIEEESPIPVVDINIITNKLTATLPAKDCCAPPPSKVYECVPVIEKARPLPDLPLDIIVTDIFTRLPAECIFQLWQQTNSSDVLYDYFTINANFIRAHLDRGFRAITPTIVIQSLTQYVGNVVKLFISEDGTAENFKAATSLDLLGSCNNPYNCKAPFSEEQATHLGSCHGFLIFECLLIHFSAVFRIWNPITKEQVILAPRRYTPVRVCGFYFHPLKKEYEVVCVRTSRTKPRWDFQILSLRTKSKRGVGTCYYGPSIKKPASVFVNGTLYWMVYMFMPQAYLTQHIHRGN